MRQENELPWDRISRLTGAILRISESLDLGTFLREVVDGARALTGARFGGVATLGGNCSAKPWGSTSCAEPTASRSMAPGHPTKCYPFTSMGWRH